MYGGSLLLARGGKISYYKRGRFREIGPVAPDDVLLQCVQYSHTLRGALLCIGESGAGVCASESAIYNCVGKAYAKLEIKLQIGGGSRCPYSRSTDEARKDTDPPDRIQSENCMIFDGFRKISAGTPTTPLPSTASWAYRASDMCLKVAGAIRDSLISWEAFIYYLAYMSLYRGGDPHVFTRDIIRRPGRRGIQLLCVRFWRSTNQLSGDTAHWSQFCRSSKVNVSTTMRAFAR